MLQHTSPPLGRALIGLGANLSFHGLEGAALLDAACVAIAEAGLRVLARSRFWRSAPWPPSSQPPFVNAVAELATQARAPQEIYAILEGVEARFGRERTIRWGPRTLDLDLLDAGGVVLDASETGGLIVPHPRLHQRAFVLGPLCDIAPDWRHPVLGETARALYAALPGGQSAEPL